MSANTYYALAVVFVTLSAIFGYIGANRSGDEQAEKLSRKVDELGDKISSLPTTHVTPQKVEDIESEYKDLVREYLSTLPEKSQELKIEQEKRRLAQLEATRTIKPVVDFVSSTLGNLAAEFTKNGVPISFEATPFPANVFSNEPYQMKLNVHGQDYWSVHFVDREVNKIGLMFVLIESRGQSEHLTNESIVFRWVGSDRYGFSLNNRISDEAKSNIFDGLNTNSHALSGAEQDLKRLLVNLVKYEVARKA
jgi:hypothetical protein